MAFGRAARSACTLRMRHLLTRLGPAAAVAGLLLSGCGGSESASTEATTTTAVSAAKLVKAGLRPPAGCYLTIYLGETVSVAEKQNVESLMLTSKRVESVSFVSKGLALKRFAQSKPVLARRMRVNLFPDTFEVVPHTRLDVAPIIVDFSAGVAGVTNVRASRPCAQTA
jgi:hypothetical protein